MDGKKVWTKVVVDGDNFYPIHFLYENFMAAFSNFHNNNQHGFQNTIAV
jgi:hypothetical protein